MLVHTSSKSVLFLSIYNVYIFISYIITFMGDSVVSTISGGVITSASSEEILKETGRYIVLHTLCRSMSMRSFTKDPTTYLKILFFKFMYFNSDILGTGDLSI